MTYEEFLLTKQKQSVKTGFDIPIEQIDDRLFDFQKFAVSKSLAYGRYALFEECGLGKTFQQLVWADKIVRSINQHALIMAPLGVSGQTIEEAKKIDIDVKRVGHGKSDNKIEITNYEQIDNVDFDKYSAIVLDESSILKNFEGKTKKKIIEIFRRTPYKLACTATPSPNDDMEICNHAEFLNQGSRVEILATYFTHDGGETSKWRLKGHAQKMFWNFIKEWSLFVSNPSDIGFDGSKYILPKLNLIERFIESPNKSGRLFNDVSINATDFNQELRNTMDLRMGEVSDILSKSKDQTLIWVKQNIEADHLRSVDKSIIEVRGNEMPESKEEKLLAFARGEINRLVTKKKIACYGMNFQNCHRQIDASPDFSFEMTYQAIRRSYRFGQKFPVDFFMIVTDTMQNVLKAIQDKQQQFENMKYHLTQN